MNYNYIVNPLTNRKCNIHSKNGRRILNQYVNQEGGRCSICKFDKGGNAGTCPWKAGLSNKDRIDRLRENNKTGKHSPTDPYEVVQKSPVKSPIERELSRQATPKSPSPSAESPLPGVIDLKKPLEDIFKEHDQSINNILSEINIIDCKEPQRLPKPHGQIYEKFIQKNILKRMTQLCQFYYDFYRSGHPLGLIYANLYIDFIMSKMIIICNEDAFLTKTPKYRDWRKEQYQLEEKYGPQDGIEDTITINEPGYIRTIKQNPFQWFDKDDTPTIYWDDMSFVDNRKVLLKQLFIIKSKLADNLLKRLKRSQPTKTDKFRFLISKEDLDVNNLKEEDIIETWDWDIIQTCVPLRDVGSILHTIIDKYIPYNTGGWGMFRLFNLVEIDTNYGQVSAINTKMCSCICNSIIFITILLITGYPRQCIFARLDRHPAEQTEGRASHWGVDVCPYMSGFMARPAISFFKACELNTIGERCVINKNIFYRYTTDIFHYYKEAIEWRMRIGEGSGFYLQENLALKMLITQLEKDIKQFVDDEPCKT